LELVTTDMLLEGSCFILEEAGAYRVGRKALAVNLSDIAAMAGIPERAVVSLALPRQKTAAIAQELDRGWRELAAEYEVDIVGGDTNTWDGPLAISITLIGKATPKGPVCRSGAKIGDWIMVTGPLGGSILGHHLDFTPRVREALLLHSLVDLHSMIDISDGLAQDLHHICRQSACGAELWADRIPLTPAAVALGTHGSKSPLQHALGDGEDFELIFTVSAADGQFLLGRQPLEGTTISQIGTVVADGYWLWSNGVREALLPQGYVHRFG
jgi:thiamine-monophosphate kinase